MDSVWLTLGLGLVFVTVMVTPFLVKRVEANLEAFLFVMGVIAASIASVWSWHLVREALIEPIKITVAVLIAGLIFHYLRHQIRVGVASIIHRVSWRAFVLLVVIVLGLMSSIITAIIAALILVEVVSAMDLPRRPEVRFVVLGCFAIGLGAALTPLGEPLSTIAVAKLKGEPHNAGFFYLVQLLGRIIVPGILALGLAAVFLVGRHVHEGAGLTAPEKPEKLSHVAARGGKVYLFVMALLLLGSGFKPLIDVYLAHVPAAALYWANSASAILDNATLTAAEIGPSLETLQIKSALMGLLISGGALIPGNIPNIISAGKLKIGSREWAVIGLPVAAVVMALYFPIVLFLR
jgi:predicted cation transporter